MSVTLLTNNTKYSAPRLFNRLSQSKFCCISTNRQPATILWFKSSTGTRHDDDELSSSDTDRKVFTVNSLKSSKGNPLWSQWAVLFMNWLATRYILLIQIIDRKLAPITMNILLHALTGSPPRSSYLNHRPITRCGHKDLSTSFMHCKATRYGLLIQIINRQPATITMNFILHVSTGNRYDLLIQVTCRPPATVMMTFALHLLIGHLSRSSRSRLQPATRHGADELFSSGIDRWPATVVLFKSSTGNPTRSRFVIMPYRRWPATHHRH